MLTFSLFVYTFVIFVSIYILWHLRKMKLFDLCVLAIAAMTLLLIASQIPLDNSKQIELFTTTTAIPSKTDINTVLAKLNPVELEEDIESIQSDLMTYLTIFNKQSFNNMGRSWFNIAPQKTDANSIYSFDLAPISSRITGLYLGNNRIIGPLSNNLEIQYHNSYTMVLVCKHGALSTEQSSTSDIELLKLYANSPNNNAWSLFIKKGSVTNTNNTQTGALMFQFANQEPIACKIDKDHNFINFEKDVLIYYFIVKDIDNVRIMMMTEKSNRIYQIMKFSVTNTDINFSNKEMIINRLMNWNANIYAFGIYNTAFTDEQVSNFYSHFMEEYLKNIDPNFTRMMGQYNDTIRLLKSLTKCPMDKDSCNKCDDVKNWSDITQVVTAPITCKSAINGFCSINTSVPLCKCWDSTSPNYNSESCKTYRDLLTGEKKNIIDQITTSDVDTIKTKYGLINPDQCPTAIAKQSFITNEYPTYNWSKLKVGLDGEEATTDTKVRSQYPEVVVIDESISVAKAKNDITPPPPDSFFSRFMKVVVPS